METHRIGVAPMTGSDHLMHDILNGMRESATNLGSHYELPGIDLVIESRTSREQRHLGNREFCITDFGHVYIDHSVNISVVELYFFYCKH